MIKLICVGRCVTGNVAEFVLEPEWSLTNSIFGCHIEPMPDYHIYDIEFYINKDTEIVNNRRFRAKKVFKGHHPARAIDKYV